ncbi:ribosomal L7Ae/L30e/S12e/Gadd45 family protein [Liberiplasma polymorphum]|uniref:ribosomal L7Ae/L30e/S12e/Gadd45 family protein n=1 Tax=Liberiplasma polymorphum TaxID=3374570 RepID=UPI003770B0D0
MNSKQTLSLLGLAKRAGKIVDGEGRVLSSFQAQKPLLIFLANDAGENITKKINDKASFYKVEIIKDFTTDELSKAIGKNNRKVLALNDPQFIKQIKR